MAQDKFTQPDPYTCTPTSLAYLLHKTMGKDFNKTKDLLIGESYKHYSDIKENGIDFDQIQNVAKSLKILCRITETKPVLKAYLTIVTKYPINDFKNDDFIKKAIMEDSLRIEKPFFIYPYGHAIAVFEQKNGKATVFDSLLGTETTISLTELEKYIEQPVSYLSVIE